MISTTKLPDAVQWSEGMLLSPQHFQQNDIYWHQHLRHRLQAVTPHYWGLQHMRCSLIKEVIHISELECVLPDGLAVQFPGNSARQPAGNLELDVGSNLKSGTSMRVWLWVRERGATAARHDDNERRYNSILGPQTADENTGEANLAIERLQIVFQLYLGTSAPSSCACPLLELERDAQGLLAVTKYHPPMLHLSSADFHQEHSLHRRIDRLNETLWAKTRELAGDCDDAQPDHNDQSDENRQHLAVARQLASCLPQLAINIEPQCHPSRLYQAVAQVVGQVASIGPNPLPLNMKPYLHDDCMPQFQAAFDYIEAKLALVNTSYESLPFAQVGKQPGRFARRLFADTSDQVIVELKPRGTQTQDQLRRWMNEAIIANENLLPQLLRTRLQGALVRPLTAREIKDNKFRPNAALFVIKSQDIATPDKGLQPAFSAEQSLLIQGEPNADMPASIVLYRKKQPLHAVRSKAPEPTAPAAQYA